MYGELARTRTFVFVFVFVFVGSALVVLAVALLAGTVAGLDEPDGHGDPRWSDGSTLRRCRPTRDTAESRRANGSTAA